MQPYTYIFTEIEKKWQTKWAQHKVGTTVNQSPNPPQTPKHYILNMFPYPSGSGLHVGHHTGYIASDILSRYYKHNGYCVMNPMGFDAFGLPAEQYAIQTGQHPAITTAQNIAKYKEQFDQIALDFDWDRVINTSEPAYYKWTQWIFLKLFNSWYNLSTQKAESIHTLTEMLARDGNAQVAAICDPDTPIFSAEEWNAFSETMQQAKLLHYRMAYLKDSMVNWCEILGTVLANEEVKDGCSERGGYPVIRKKMRQWSLRIGAYAERLLTDLDILEWPASTKEIQRNWIGRSEGAHIVFRIQGQRGQTITVFTTRPETIFGVCFIALAPEHPWVAFMANQTGNPELLAYIQQATKRSDRNRLSNTSFLSGVFIGACVIHPFTGAPLPIWVADYVLPNYGTAAIMGVPAHDSRDYTFAQSFDLLVLPIIESDMLVEDGPYESIQGKMINSDFLNGLSALEARKKIIAQLIKKRIGTSQINYKIQDPVFSRQRYWGEPVPIYYKSDGLPYSLPEDQLPLLLPAVSSYQPQRSGAPPLSNAPNWTTREGYPLELTTMPGWAGSSWYFLRYMDPHNDQTFASEEKQAYWNNVDLYIGGAEQATSHLIYARFWTKFLYDLGYIHMSEPFPKLFHQGMVQNLSALVYQIKNSNTFVSVNLKAQYDTISIHVPIEFIEKKDILNLKAFKDWRPEFRNATFLLEEGVYICGRKMEKMSKSKHNVINPDTIIAQYGADALRLYLMFLGPLEQSKIWDMSNIEGIARFLGKVWRFVHQAKASWTIEVEATSQMLHIIHKTIKKITEDIQKYSFNTAISSLMICINALSPCHPVAKSIVSDFIILLHPFAPYITAELWEIIGQTERIDQVPFPTWDPAYLSLTGTQAVYSIAVNGKVRTKMTFDSHVSHAVIEKEVLENPHIQKWIKGQSPKNVIIILHKMVNVVL